MTCQTITRTTTNGLYLALLEQLIYYPDRTVGPRGHTTAEACATTLWLTDVNQSVLSLSQRHLNYPFLAAEFVWMWCGRNDTRMISYYCDSISQFSDNGVDFFGAYGPPLTQQLAYVCHSLRQDPATRQAVLTLWQPSPPPSKDIPCTLTMQFLYRDGQLNLIVTMRSSDAWLGIPYDVFNFSSILKGVCWLLGDADATWQGVKPGHLIMQLGSSHLYARNYEQAQQVLDNPVALTMVTPPLPTYCVETMAHLEWNLRHSTIPLHTTDEPTRSLYEDLFCLLHYRSHKDINLVPGRWQDVLRFTSKRA